MNAVLIVGFGAPSRLSDVRSFLQGFRKDRAIPEARLEEVYSHYQAVGGSPYNGSVRLQAKALEQQLVRRGHALPIYVGMRNWRPYLGQVFEQMAADGIKRVIAVTMAPHAGRASTDRYRASVEEARAKLGVDAPRVDHVPAWFDRDGFIQAIVDRVATATGALDARARAEAAWVFTAHSIPEAAARGTPYVEQLGRTIARVASELGVREPMLAYQSASEGPEERWLGPDILDVLGTLAERGRKRAVVTPVGFLTDHVEVLYDLDVEASQLAGERGIEMIRPKTVGDHPSFIAMLADLVEATLAA